MIFMMSRTFYIFFPFIFGLVWLTLTIFNKKKKQRPFNEAAFLEKSLFSLPFPQTANPAQLAVMPLSKPTLV